MIVVTTPTGQIGSQLVRNLLGANEAVRVIARDPAKLDAKVRERVDIVEGSHSDAAVVEKAFKNADAVFWLVPPNPQVESVEAAYVEFSQPACDAFVKEGVEHVVGVSSLGRGKPQAKQAGYITASLAMDDFIASTDVNYRALAMPGFMDNILRQAATIKNQGAFYDVPSGDLKMATCATRDIAAAAASLLTERSWSGVGEVRVLGPENLSNDDLARIMTEVLETHIRYEQLSVENLKSGLLEHGYSKAMAQGVADMMVAIKEGIYSNEPRTPETNTPTSFRTWCKEVLKPALS